MTPLQEMLNAGTMTLPLALALPAADELRTHVGKRIVAAGIVMHFPFSFAYHVTCATTADDQTKHVLRRMDLMAILASGALFSLATSGSVAWFAAMAAFNGTCALRTWSNAPRSEQLFCRLMSTAGYIAPVAVKDGLLCAKATASFASIRFAEPTRSFDPVLGHALAAEVATTQIDLSMLASLLMVKGWGLSACWTASCLRSRRGAEGAPCSVVNLSSSMQSMRLATVGEARVGALKKRCLPMGLLPKTRSTDSSLRSTGRPGAEPRASQSS